MSTVMKARILLTGGSGMVGRNLLEHPRAPQWDFIAPSSDEVNLVDFDATRRFFADVRPDLVIHAAGKVGGIQANIAQPVEFLVENTDMGRNVVLAARDAGVQHLLNLGSSCMYPRNAPSPLTENMVLTGELEPTNEGYGLAKIYTARLCQYIAREAPQFAYKTLIPCNLYGRYDKFDPTQSHLIPAVIDKIHRAKEQGRDEVEIWGDGTARREFMYAGDLADAIFHMLGRFSRLPNLCNIGLGYDRSIEEYYAVVADVIGWRGRFVHDLSRPVGMGQKLVETSWQVELGWSPRTELRAGIALAYDYYRREMLQ